MAVELGRTLLGWEIAGRPASAGIWFQTVADTPTIAQMSTIADDLVTMYEASAYQGDLDENTVLVAAEVQLFEVETVPVSPTYPYGRRNTPTTIAVLGNGVPVAGGQVGTTLGCSPQVAMGVSLQTGTPGRSYRGRVYLPGLLENSLSEAGVWTAGAAGEAAQLVTDWIAVITAATPSMVAVVHSLAVPTDTEIVAVLGRERSRTQRRRVGRGG